MSHKLEISAAQMAKEGFLVIKDSGNIKAVDILEKTCRELKLAPPIYDTQLKIAGELAPGYAIRLPNWYKPVSINTETGQLAFDNYSDFTPDHPDVKAGKRRVGEQGRWGDLSELDKFRQTYEQQLNAHLAQMQQDVAIAQGHYCTVVEQTPERIVLEIEV
jgi:hypothetical protein